MEKPRTDDRHPDLCCCPPRVLLWGSTTSSTVALSNKMEEDENVMVRADANASAPPASADGTSGGQRQLRVRKDIDAVVLTATYRVHWRVEASCKPVAVSLQLGGVHQNRLECLDLEGFVDVSKASPYLFDELRARTPGRLQATLRARDCAGNLAECSIELQEP